MLDVLLTFPVILNNTDFRVNKYHILKFHIVVVQNSLSVLMERMTQSQPVFIRCIKPNSKKSPKLFEDEYVKAQVCLSGSFVTYNTNTVKLPSGHRLIRTPWSYYSFKVTLR